MERSALDFYRFVSAFYLVGHCLSISAFALGWLLLPRTTVLGARIALIAAAAVAITSTFLFWTFDYSLWLFTGHTIFNGQQIFEWTRLIELVVIVATFGVAAAMARGKAAAAVRTLFGLKGATAAV